MKKTSLYLFLIFFISIYTACSSDSPVLEAEVEKPVIVIPAIPDVTTVIKDVEFKKYIQEAIKNEWVEYDTKEPFGVLSSDEVSKIKSLDFSAYNNKEKITSIEGLEYFTGLEYLDCSWQKITKLDLRNNPELKVLKCAYNILPTLDLSKNTKLEDLVCNDNLLKKLDVSNLEELQTLNFSKNALTEIKLENNVRLYSLDCSENAIKELDLANNLRINSLNASNNQLGFLDVSKSMELKKGSINLLNNPLSLLYVWKDFENKYKIPTQTKISERFYLSYVDDITTVVEDGIFKKYIQEAIKNEWAKYDTDMPKGILSSDEVAKITFIYASGLGIKKIDAIEYFTALKELRLNGNKLAKVTLTNNKELESLNIGDNQIILLDISENKNLKSLISSKNKDLRKLDLSKHSKLEVLFCSENNLSSLDLSNLKELQILNCSLNNLGQLDLSKNINLSEITCSNNNQLQKLETNSGNNLIKVICKNSSIKTNLSLKGSEPYVEEIDADISNAFEVDNYPQLKKLSLVSSGAVTFSNSNIPKSLKISAPTITIKDYNDFSKFEQSDVALNASAQIEFVNIKNLTAFRRPGFISTFNKISIQNCDNLQYIKEEGFSGYDNRMEVLNCSKLKYFENIRRFSSVKLKECNALEIIDVRTNVGYGNLRGIYIDNCNALQEIIVRDNSNLTTVSVANCKNLEKLALYDVKALGFFDIKGNPALKNLSVSNHHLLGGNLDLGDSPNIESLQLSYITTNMGGSNMGFSNIDISKCTKLKSLWLSQPSSCNLYVWNSFPNGLEINKTTSVNIKRK